MDAVLNDAIMSSLIMLGYAFSIYQDGHDVLMIMLGHPLSTMLRTSTHFQYMHQTWRSPAYVSHAQTEAAELLEVTRLSEKRSQFLKRLLVLHIKPVFLRTVNIDDSHGLAKLAFLPTPHTPAAEPKPSKGLG